MAVSCLAEVVFARLLMARNFILQGSDDHARAWPCIVESRFDSEAII